MATVLVVDDSPLDRTLVEHLLKPTNMSVRFAENGSIASRCIRDNKPDIVVTDLMMPEMDGLQFVRAVRRDHPDLPVILMTSRSTEETAIEALRVGAASFVPKSRLADRLINTLHQVLALKHVDHPYSELLRCLLRSDSRFCLDSELSVIPQLVDLVQKAIASLRVCDATESIRISLALEEGLLNALVHGSLELTTDVRERGFHANTDYFKRRIQQDPYRNRKIHSQIELTSRQAKFVIQDEGPGFDTSLIPGDSETTPFEHGGGRGLRLMKTFMHEVSYNAAGNELTLVRRFD